MLRLGDSLLRAEGMCRTEARGRLGACVYGEREDGEGGVVVAGELEGGVSVVGGARERALWKPNR